MRLLIALPGLAFLALMPVASPEVGSLSDETIIFLIAVALLLWLLVLYVVPTFLECMGIGTGYKHGRSKRKLALKPWAWAGCAVVLAGGVMLFKYEPAKLAMPQPTLAPPEVVAAVPAAAKPKTDGDFERVEPTISKWAAAWSEGDVEAYLASYSPAFKPADGSSRAAWEAQRRQRVQKAKNIRVKVQDLRVTWKDANHAQAVFRQDYRATGLLESAHKTLSLEASGQAWLITAEAVTPLQ